MEHAGEKKLQFWIEEELLQRFDVAIKKCGYKNRADWFREKVRESIREAKKNDC